jgi:hypothetical protein
VMRKSLGMRYLCFDLGRVLSLRIEVGHVMFILCRRNRDKV